jgi:hypothetical protein
MLIHGIAITAKALLITHIVFRTQIDNFAPLTLSQHGAHHIKGGLAIIKPTSISILAPCTSISSTMGFWRSAET